ncbi:MAG TPA: RsmG family class I SAM-dependent methyltransferase [Balneolales bacterium]|nr:RsmG family class I SAM-dependent methyltransferase [Balneolales bacterium]
MEHRIEYHNVSRETFEKINELFQKYSSNLKKYADLLYWWNNRLNLVSRNASRNLIEEHIYHSLLLSYIPSFYLTDNFVDAGTGGGLPGIPLSICFPQRHFYLNDIVSKKIFVVKQIIKDLGLSNAETFSGPIESFDINIDGGISIISKHAFKLDDLISLTNNINWFEIFLLKGCRFSDELSTIPYPLYIDCYQLDNGTNNKFYTDKCMLRISR